MTRSFPLVPAVVVTLGTLAALPLAQLSWAGVASAQATLTSSPPSAAAVVNEAVKNLAAVKVIEATESQGPVHETSVAEPSKQAAMTTLTGTEDGISIDLEFVEVRQTAYIKANTGGLELITFGSLPAAKLAPYANKWYVAKSGSAGGSSLSFGLAGFKPTLAELGSVICVNTTTNSTTANGSTSTTTSGCSLAGSTVTSSSPSHAVVRSTGLGDETITFAAIHGRLLPTKVEPFGASKNSATFTYPSSAPRISAPSGATAIPAAL